MHGYETLDYAWLKFIPKLILKSSHTTSYSLLMSKIAKLNQNSKFINLEHKACMIMYGFNFSHDLLASSFT